MIKEKKNMQYVGIKLLKGLRNGKKSWLKKKKNFRRILSISGVEVANLKKGENEVSFS